MGDGGGLHLVPAPHDGAAIEVLADRLAAAGGGRLTLDALVARLGRRARRTRLPLRVRHRAWTWEAPDRRDVRWWPQGVTTGSDATPETAHDGREGPVLVSWYAKARPDDHAWAGAGKGGQGSRISVLDPASGRYEHVLLVRPTGDPASPTAPLRVHAGGIVWSRDHLHVGATAHGLATCHLGDLMHTGDDEALVARHGGHRYLLPVRLVHRASADDGVEPLRYSFLSLDAGSGAGPSGLVVGEYGRGRSSRRLVRFDLDPASGLLSLGADGRATATLTGDGVAGMQGAVLVDGRHLTSVSRGPWKPGSVWVGEPGSLAERRWELPMGPEDLSYDPGRRELWTVTEHPRRRWICALDADRFLD